MAMGPSTDAESKMLDWRTASISAGGNCVQVAALGGDIVVRDSKSPERGFQRYKDREWRGFIIAIKSGIL